MNRLRALLRELRHLFLSRLLDRSGESSEAVRLADIGLDRSGYHDYEPSGWRSLARALRGLGTGRGDGFLDVGCGKGRVLSQAARRPFDRVLGVEISEQMAAQARTRLERERRRRRCGAIEVLVTDVTTWELPDDITVIYFYNVLSGESLRAMLDRIAESAARVPRRLLFLYNNPEHEDEVTAHPAFVRRERRGRRHWSATDPRWIAVFDVGDGERR